MNTSLGANTGEEQWAPEGAAVQLLSMRGAGWSKLPPGGPAGRVREGHSTRAAGRCHLGVGPTLAGEEGTEEEPR